MTLDQQVLQLTKQLNNTLRIVEGLENRIKKLEAGRSTIRVKSPAESEME